MPSSQQFLDAFSLLPDDIIAGRKILHVTANEMTIVPYHHYEYDFEIEVEDNRDFNSLKSSLQQLEQMTLSVKAIRNYYQCSVKVLSFDSHHLKIHGYARR